MSHRKIGELVQGIMNETDERIGAVSHDSPVLTGLNQLDAMVGGFHPSELIILGARPAVGKTAFSLNVVSHMARTQMRGALIFSLKMEGEHLAKRLICMVAGVYQSQWNSGSLEPDGLLKMRRAAKEIQTWPVLIDDTPQATLSIMHDSLAEAKAIAPVDLVVVDYAQLMSESPRGGPRRKREAMIIRSLKSMAREFRVPLLVLSCFSRVAEAKQPDKRHAGESYAHSEEADVVLTLSLRPLDYRPGPAPTVDLRVTKNPRGPTGEIPLVFDTLFQQFAEFSPTTSRTSPNEEISEDPPY